MHTYRIQNTEYGIQNTEYRQTDDRQTDYRHTDILALLRFELALAQKKSPRRAQIS